MSVPVTGTGGAVAAASLTQTSPAPDQSLAMALQSLAENHEIFSTIAGKLHVFGASASDILSIILLSVTIMVTVITGLYELSERMYKRRMRKRASSVQYRPRDDVSDLPITFGAINDNNYSDLGGCKSNGTKSLFKITLSILVVVLIGGGVFLQTVFPDSVSMTYLLNDLQLSLGRLGK